MYFKSLGFLTADEQAEALAYVNGDDDLSDGLYQKLFEHFCNNGEMPYGTAKAVDGDPFQWIEDRLQHDLDTQ